MTTTPLAGRIAIRVNGTPIPQGSKRIGRRAGRPVILDDNDRLLTRWRDNIHHATEDAFRYHDTLTGPLRVWLRFAVSRPTSHYRTGRNAHLLRDNAPLLPSSRTHGDIDKLARAALDALTGPAWLDDSQVVDLRARKFYAGEHELAPTEPGVDIVIEEVL